MRTQRALKKISPEKVKITKKAFLEDPSLIEVFTLEDLEDSLTDKEKLFVNQYMIHFNGSRAIREAYPDNKYQPARVAVDLLKRPKIARYLMLKQKQLRDRFMITQDKIISELANIAFFNIAEMYDEAGRMLPPTSMPRHISAAISSIKERVVMTKDNGEVVMDREYKLSSKEQALDMLAKHLGLYEKDNDQKKLFAQMVFNMPHNNRNTELLNQFEIPQLNPPANESATEEQIKK